jgi:hypothetical protein
LKETDLFVSALNPALFLLSFPPVEQRVKVMDTLDKKMQTILEREDLSEDERLKLEFFLLQFS